MRKHGGCLFQYRPLPPGQIRIVSITSDTTAQMRHVNIKKSATLKYIALSYTWGASTETFPFECDGRNLPVRENLRLALTRLRYILDAPIWIDAMCIDQDDDHEKMGTNTNDDRHLQRGGKSGSECETSQRMLNYAERRAARSGLVKRSRRPKPQSLSFAASP
jgi:hypothetical protein